MTPWSVRKSVKESPSEDRWRAAVAIAAPAIRHDKAGAAATRPPQSDARGYLRERRRVTPSVRLLPRNPEAARALGALPALRRRPIGPGRPRRLARRRGAARAL